MKKIVSLVLVLALCVMALSGCGGTTAAGGETEAPAEKVIKIGVFEPASGDNGPGGKQETLGIQYANSLTPTVTVGGEEYKVELVVVDNESSNDKAPSAAAELVSQGVSVVLGSYGSGVSIAASDVFGQAGIPVIGVTCTNAQVTMGNEHYFRICFIDDFQSVVLASYAFNGIGAKTAYCLSKLGDDYSGNLCKLFENAFEASGGAVISETFPDGNSDFTSYLTNAKNQGAEVFFSPISTEAAALVIEQANAQGFDIPILAGDTWDANVITGAATGTDLSINVTTFYQEGGDPEFDSSVKEWINGDATNLSNNGGNDMISAVTAMGYDAYYFALEAIKKADSADPAAIMAAIWDTTLDGVTGPIAILKPDGNADRSTAYIKAVETETGTWKFVAEQSA